MNATVKDLPLKSLPKASPSIFAPIQDSQVKSEATLAEQQSKVRAEEAKKARQEELARFMRLAEAD